MLPWGRLLVRGLVLRVPWSPSGGTFSEKRICFNRVAWLIRPR